MKPTNPMWATNQSPMRLNVTIAIVLVTAAVIAWVSVYYLMLMGGMQVTGGMVGMFVSPNLSSLFLFLLIWMLGMVAMMFPAIIPVISKYNALTAKSTPQSLIGSVLFIAGYLAMYLVLGAVAYLVVLLVLSVASMVPFLSQYGIVAAGAVLVVTGLWQLTPFKRACLKCSASPQCFFENHSRQGFGGALRMGAEHGYYCVGCCSMYMFVMFVVAGMSLPAMVLLAIMITVEKALLNGARWFNWLIAAVFIILGLLVWIVPSASMIL